MVKSLDEVIERLQYKADNIKAKLEPSYFTECIDYLKSLPREDKWIPCSERLPEKSDAYLVTVPCLPNENNVLKLFYHTQRGQWFSAGDYIHNDVLAWQLLPEPYKAEQMKGE